MHPPHAPLGLTFFLVLLAPALGQVQDNKENISWGKVREYFSGELRLNAFQFGQTSPIENEKQFLEADLKVTCDHSLKDAWSLSATTRFRVDSSNKTNHTVGFLEDDLQRYAAAIDELTLTYYGDRIEFIVGKQFFTWGVADGYKPTDSLNPLDLLDLPTLEKIGTPAASLFLYGDHFDTQLVVLPFFTPSRLPASDNRWAPDITPVLSALTNQLGFTPQLNNDGRELHAHQLKNLQGGIRFTSSSLISGWDLALSAFRGIDTIGVNELDFALPIIHSRQIFQRYVELGASFSTTSDAFVYYGEGAWRITDDNALDDDYLKYSLGINYTSYDILPDLIEETKFMLEYAGEKRTRNKSVDNNIVPSQQYVRPFRNSILGSIRFQFSSETELTLSAAYNIDAGDYTVSPEFKYHFDNGLTATAAINIFEGAPDSFFGRWDRNDRFALSLQYPF